MSLREQRLPRVRGQLPPRQLHQHPQQQQQQQQQQRYHWQLDDVSLDLPLKLSPVLFAILDPVKMQNIAVTQTFTDDKN